VTEPSSNFDAGDLHPEQEWKNEVASRLDTYRTRSKRKLSGDFSMRFNFDGEPARPREPVCMPAVPESESELLAEPKAEAQNEVAAESVAEVIEEKIEPARIELPHTIPPTQPPLRPSVPFKRKVVMEANVIEFPRLFPPEPPSNYSVAEPVLPSTPRILDAPEIAQPLLETPILDGMRLERREADPLPELELPLQVAPVSRRLQASVGDALIVALGTMLFAAITYKMLPDLQLTTPILGGMALVSAIFWAVYQYLFIVYGARTPGMAILQLAFSTFQGTAPNRRERRRRILALALSCSSLMLGFLWAFFDEDTLCWHDRISRTYAFRQKP
jgi:uncharacterized RDD family membrane protein YckC